MMFASFYFKETEDSDSQIYATAGECLCDCVAAFLEYVPSNAVVHDEFIATPLYDDWASPVWYKLEEYMHDH